MGFSEILRGVEIVMPERGLRPTHASALLLWYSKPSADVRTVLELGSGSGIVTIGIAKLYGRKSVGIELDEGLVELARRSALMNGLSGSVSFIVGDVRRIRELVDAESFDMVVSNPPHSISKVPSPNERRALGRSGGEETVSHFCDAMAWSLRNRGEFVLVLSPESLTLWIESLRARRLEVKRMVFFHPAGKKAELVALRGRKNAGLGLVVDPPLMEG